MVNNLDLILDCDNFSVEGPTLRMFLEAYGIYDTCLKDISTIKDEIEKLSKLQEKYLKMKGDILERINFLSKLETKIVVKVEEDKENSLIIKVLKVSADDKILVNFIDEETFDCSEIEDFENCLDEIIERYPNAEIYSNKHIKYNYTQLDLFRKLA